MRDAGYRYPNKANGLYKRKDDGNVKPIEIERLQAFLSAIDRKSYTGLREYVIIMLMLDTGMRTTELLHLRNSDFDEKARSITVSKLIASFQEIKPKQWQDWLFPNYEGARLKVDHLDPV